MSTSPDASRTTVPNEWPLRFHKHNFSAYCYDTIGCKVLYNNFYHVDDSEDTVSSSSSGGDYRKNWGGGLYLDINNFPSPARVTWRSKDGAAHEAHIDMGEIFKGQLVLHNVARQDIPMETVAMLGGPSIFLEVNDRTISVYMQATVYLREPRIPGNKLSNFRDDLILAYSHIY